MHLTERFMVFDILDDASLSRNSITGSNLHKKRSLLAACGVVRVLKSILIHVGDLYVTS